PLRRGGADLGHQDPTGPGHLDLLSGTGRHVGDLALVTGPPHSVWCVLVGECALDDDRGPADRVLPCLRHHVGRRRDVVLTVVWSVVRVGTLLVHHSPIPVCTMSLAKGGLLGSTRTSCSAAELRP